MAAAASVPVSSKRCGHLRPELKELELVHRLDRDTSGCLLIAKRRAALRNLHAQLREREMDKHYRALLLGRWPFGIKTITLPLMTNLKQGGERVVQVHENGQEAITHFKPLEQFGEAGDADGYFDRHRPHAPDSRALGALRSSGRRAMRSTAIARPMQSSRQPASGACFCMRTR